MNQLLRRALADAGLDVKTVATNVDVDPKTVEGWLAGKVVPYPRHRARLCAILGLDEEYLWPGITSGYPLTRQTEAVGLLASYATRSKVPLGEKTTSESSSTLASSSPKTAAS